MSSQKAALQQEANVAFSRLLRGEPTGADLNVIGLSEAVKFPLLPWPFPAGPSITFFTPDSPIVSKSYFLGVNDIRYANDSTNVNAYTTVYVPPPGVIVDLKFWPPLDVNPNPAIPDAFATLSGVDLGIKITLTKNIGGTDVSASVSTIVAMRNH